MEDEEKLKMQRSSDWSERLLQERGLGFLKRPGEWHDIQKVLVAVLVFEITWCSFYYFLNLKFIFFVLLSVTSVR